MNPEMRAFYRAVAENPVDDLPRLMFADGLEEKAGRPEQANYIRRAIELHGMKHNHRALDHGVPFGCEACKIRRELLDYETQLRTPWGMTEENWGPGFFTRHEVSGLSTFPWSRGFLSRVDMDFEEFAERGRDILLGVPIESVCLTMPRVATREVELLDKAFTVLQVNMFGGLPFAEGNGGGRLRRFGSDGRGGRVIVMKQVGDRVCCMFVRGVRVKITQITWSSRTDRWSVAIPGGTRPVGFDMAVPIMTVELGRRTCKRYE